MRMHEMHLQRAIRIVGGQAALARACGCKQQHVWNWINRDRRVPAEFVLAIERATGGRVTRHQLRPDIYPATDGNPPSIEQRAED